MTHVGPAPVASAGYTAGTTHVASYVEWGPVLAGAFLAAAISFVLLTFGTAIGLSVTSPWPNAGVSAKVISTLAVRGALVQQIGALMAWGCGDGGLGAGWRGA